MCIIQLQNYIMICQKSTFYEYYHLSDPKQDEIDTKYDSVNLTLYDHGYNQWHKEKLFDVKEFDDLPPLEGDEEEVKEGKGLKNLTPNKLLTRLLISSA